ncbi:phytanoyl-CoA dioxygenase family protein [Pilimelia columellifera]|uniref:phytanoyl-CoA dioxygenase family protein n=1 Tax=Pilimelia columellifera TaxID=706574 RepID=UPI0031D57C1C
MRSPLAAFAEAFDTDGFGIIRGVTDTATAGRLRELLGEHLPAPAAPVPTQVMLGQLVQRDRRFAELATTGFLLDTLAMIFGTTPQLIGSYGHVKPARTTAHTGPHSDVAHLPGVPHHRSTLMVKVAYALTPTRAGNGATRLHPGSHRDANPADQGPSVAAELDLGDMLIFHANLRHTATANPTVHARLGLWFVYALPWMRVFPGEEYTPAFLQHVQEQTADRPELAAVYGLVNPYATA